MKEKESNEEPGKEDEKDEVEEDSELFKIRLERKEKEKSRRLTEVEKE